MTISTGETPAIVVACENGDVLRLDARGEVIARGHVDGRATQILSLTTAAGSQVVIATDTGAVAAFAY